MDFDVAIGQNQGQRPHAETLMCLRSLNASYFQSNSGQFLNHVQEIDGFGWPKRKFT